MESPSALGFYPPDTFMNIHTKISNQLLCIYIPKLLNRGITNMKDVRLTRKFENMLKDKGYEFKRYSSDHKIFKGVNGHTVSVPSRLNRMIYQRLVKEVNAVCGGNC